MPRAVDVIGRLIMVYLNNRERFLPLGFLKENCGVKLNKCMGYETADLGSLR